MNNFSKKHIIGIVIATVIALLIPIMSVGAQDANPAATPTPSGWLSGYVNQGAPGLATPPPNATVVASNPEENGFDGTLPQNYDAQGEMFSVSVYGEEGKDGASWTAWDWLVATLNKTVSGVKVLIDNYGAQGTYAEINGNAGDQFAFKCESTPCQIDFSWQPTATPSATPIVVPTTEVPPTETDVPPTGTPVTPTPAPKKGHWCVECLQVEEQSFDCVFPFADYGGMVTEIKAGSQVITAAATIYADRLSFNKLGDYLQTNPLLTVTIAGRNYPLQITAGVTYDTHRKYCYIPDGTVGNIASITSGDGGGDPCPIEILVWKED